MSGNAAEAPMTAAKGGKSQAAFRTISEVADELSVAQHVLRFWESKFPQVRPLKRGGGRRYYRPEDIELLRDIRSLLYDEGYTIKGAQKLLRQRRAKSAPSAQTTDKAAGKTTAAPEQPQLVGTGDRSGPDSSATPAADVPTADPPSPEPAVLPDSAAIPPGALPPDAVPPGDALQAAADLERLRQLRSTLVALRRDLSSLLEAVDG